MTKSKFPSGWTLIHGSPDADAEHITDIRIWWYTGQAGLPRGYYFSDGSAFSPLETDDGPSLLDTERSMEVGTADVSVPVILLRHGPTADGYFVIFSHEGLRKLIADADARDIAVRASITPKLAILSNLVDDLGF